MPTQPPDPLVYLCPTFYMEVGSPEIVAFAAKSTAGAGSERERAVRLYYAVRDGIRYDPYRIDMSPDAFKATTTLAAGAGYCVPKAILLAAAARAAGIPSRLGFADVRNHLATRKLLEALGTDLFVWHGYAELYLGGAWIKATPAFNLSLCERFGVKPLEFDGEHDSILHPFDTAGKKHMEYLRDRGTFADFPLEEMLQGWRDAYPRLFGGSPAPQAREGTFEDEAAAEAAEDARRSAS